MRHLLKAVLFTLLLSVFASAVAAQSSPYGNEDPQRPAELVAPFETYEVQTGDTLWELAGVELDNFLQWREFIRVNPFLDSPGRLFERDGKVIALIKPGERLVIPDRLYIEKRLIPLSELKLAAPARAGGESSMLGILADMPWYGYALVLASALAFGYAYFRRRTSNPITSGLPVIPGGVRPEEGNRLRREFQRMASQVYADQNPDAANVPVEGFDILGVFTGQFHGPWMISYRDQSPRLKLMDGEAGYRARVRFPNNIVETLYSLQACFNPARLGERMFTRGGRFVEEEAVNTAPRPEPVPLEVGTNASSTFSVGGHTITAPAGSEIRMGANVNRMTILPPQGSRMPIVIDFAASAPSRKKRPDVAAMPRAVAPGSPD